MNINKENFGARCRLPWSSGISGYTTTYTHMNTHTHTMSITSPSQVLPECDEDKGTCTVFSPEGEMV